MIRGIHFLIKLLFLGGAAGFGVLLYFYKKEEIFREFKSWYDQNVLPSLPEGPIDDIVIGSALLLLTLLAVVNLYPKRRRKKHVSFTGSQGEVTIELEPVEATLERVVTKLPEVKAVEIDLKPMEGAGRVLVMAHAVLVKNADDDARMITARIQNYMRVHTRKILGLQDVEAKLHVRKWVMNMKTVKPEPLLLESPEQSGMTNGEMADVPEGETRPQGERAILLSDRASAYENVAAFDEDDHEETSTAEKRAEGW